MIVRPYLSSDFGEWHRMRDILWPGQTGEDMVEWLARTDAAVLVAERELSGLCGFAEVGARSIVDGCLSSPVAYLEGWYVDADMRRRGIGSGLMRAVESWSRAHGYRELGSDTGLDNLVSQQGHQRLGFTEVGRGVQYRKPL